MKIVVSFLMSAAVSFSAFAETKNPSGDVPRYAWRGYMLDSSRHFFAVREIKKTLEAMHAFGKVCRYLWAEPRHMELGANYPLRILSLNRHDVREVK